MIKISENTNSILFLFTDLAPNWISLLSAISSINPSIKIDVVYYDNSKRWPGHKNTDTKLIKYIPKSSFLINLKRYYLCKYSLIYCPGWMDRDYLKFIYLRRYESKVILPIDDWFTGSIVQLIKHPVRLLFSKVFFSHAWVAGPWQYYYARSLGFKRDKIIHNLLSASIGTSDCTANKNFDFIFCGRNSQEKAPDLFIKALSILNEKDYAYRALLVGSNMTNLDNLGLPGITTVEHCSHEDVVNYIKQSRFLVCPSRRDYHPLVIHESLLCGVPVISSTNNGAIPSLLVHGSNSLIFKSFDCHDLAKCLEWALKMSQDEEKTYSTNALLFSKRLSPTISAYSILSLIA